MPDGEWFCTACSVSLTHIDAPSLTCLNTSHPQTQDHSSPLQTPRMPDLSTCASVPCVANDACVDHSQYSDHHTASSLVDMTTSPTEVRQQESLPSQSELVSALRTLHTHYERMRRERNRVLSHWQREKQTLKRMESLKQRQREKEQEERLALCEERDTLREETLTLRGENDWLRECLRELREDVVRTRQSVRDKDKNKTRERRREKENRQPRFDLSEVCEAECTTASDNMDEQSREDYENASEMHGINTTIAAKFVPQRSRSLSNAEDLQCESESHSTKMNNQSDVDERTPLQKKANSEKDLSKAHNTSLSVRNPSNLSHPTTSLSPRAWISEKPSSQSLSPSPSSSQQRKGEQKKSTENESKPSLINASSNPLGPVIVTETETETEREEQRSRFVNPLRNRLSDLLASAQQEADSFAEIRNKYRLIEGQQTLRQSVQR